MNPQFFLITGVNGIGKSSVIPELGSLLDADIFEIHDFDVSKRSGAENSCTTAD